MLSVVTIYTLRIDSFTYFASLIDPVLCCTATEACYLQMACQSQFILVEYILGPYTIK